MQNVVYASFGTSRENMWKARTRPLWQYDYGQILKITGVTLPSNYEVHFSNEKEGGTAKTVLGNANGVAIPDEYLTTGRPIYAWIFLHAGSGDGETVYTIHIPVRRRSESTDTALTPTEKSVVSQAVEALNTAAENAAEAVAADLVDDTLSVTGKAADAAKTGEELSNLKSELNPVLHSIITKGLGVPFQYSMKSGRKYRFVNTSSTGTVSCYLSVDGTANTFLAFSGLVPGGVTFVTAQADYEYIRVYRGAADQTIQLYVAEGEYIDALTGAEDLGSTQYNNLGDSIRGQITKVAGLIDSTNNKFEELLTGYVPLESINLFDKTQVSEIGHYWNYITGQIATADNLYAADLIEVEPETVYTITSNGIVQQGCFFDDNKNFISGYVGGNYTSYEITTPQNCKYIGMSVYSGALPTYALYKGTGRTGYIPYEQLVPLRYLPKSNEITVGTNGDYTSLLQALIECDDHSVVHVKKGQYDIIEEYKAYYGETYWDDYNGYSASQNKFDRGLWLKNGVKLIFDQNAVVSFNYTGSNSKVKGNFCPIATCGNCEIEGLNLTFSGCRYAIHDDFFEYDGTEIFRNCIFNGQSNNGDTIGAGLGRSNMILIENCLFIGNASTAGGDISYHNNGYSSNSKSKVIVKDCYGENTVKFKWYGTNTEVSECIACGNRFKSITCVAHNVEPNTTVNMHLTKWNNIETDT